MRFRSLVAAGSVAALAIVSLVALIGVSTCTAGSLGLGARTVQIGTRTSGIPVVSDPAVQAQLDAFAAEMERQAEEYRQQRDEAIARGEAAPEEPKLNLAQIVATFITAGATGLGAFAAAKKSAATKDEASLLLFAERLAPLLATPSERRTPEVIASALTNGLPGSAEITTADAKPAA